jgi:histidinol-phosphate aminotransferase
MNPGYNLVSNVPSYPMYGIYGKIFGGEHIGVSYSNDKTFSLDSLLSNVNDKTRLVIIANPNSPIGDYKTIDELESVCKFLHDKNIIFLIDEAYVDFGPGTVLPLIHKYDNVVISRTFSKAFGAAGVRVGYLLGSKSLIDIVTKVQLTYPLSGVSVKFASYLLDNNEEVQDYAKMTISHRDMLCDYLESNNYEVIRSHTNSIHFHENGTNNQDTIEKLKSWGLEFKSGSTTTGTMVRIPGDDRTTWIRLSVGPHIHAKMRGILK